MKICVLRFSASLNDFSQVPHLCVFATINEKISLQILSLVELLLTGSTVVSFLPTLSENMYLKGLGYSERLPTGSTCVTF